MPDTHLSFAKVVATPTSTAWSQAYNAGSLFVALSLSGDVTTEETSLNSLGKEILNSLEAEFFTLEDKSLSAIKTAVMDSYQHIPAAIILSLSLIYIKQNILYGYSLRGGKIILRRLGKIGTILTSLETESALGTASGFLQTNDTILLQTAAFSKAISSDTLNKACELDLPNDIAETLTLPIHGIEEGAAAGIIITFHGSSQTFTTDEKPALEQTTTPEEETISTAGATFEPAAQNQAPTEPTAFPAENISTELFTPSKFVLFLTRIKTRVIAAIPTSHLSLTRRNKLILILAIVLITILISSIFLTTRTSKNSEEAALFEKIYPSAKSDYEEGEGLLSLNKNLARDDFLAAQKKLLPIKDSFTKGSREETQIKELLANVEKQLKTVSGIESVAVTKVSSPSKLLAYQKEYKDAYVTADDSFIYALDAKGVTRVDTGNDKEDTIIENDSDWTSPKGIAEYLGNIYILDSENAVLKYVPSGNNFSKSSYFAEGKAPDTTNASSLTIDGSIWLLFSNGTISKFTKGNSDSFTISALDKPLSKPGSIYTTTDSKDLYILDNGNARIVKLSKSGVYQSQYVSEQLKSASRLFIDEKAKKASFFSNGEIYELAL